jgi:hypothetical protein
MPLTYNQISAITQTKIVPKMVDNIFDSNPLLQRARKKFYTKVEGGTSIIQPLNYAQVTASDWYAGADTLSTTDNDVFTAAEYSWKQIYANITINRMDELKNNGDAAILKFVKQKVQIAEKTIQDSMGTGLYNAGSNAKAIGGLRLIISTSNTVGGISQSSYSWWQAQVDSSTTTLTLAAMQSRDNACSIGSDGPTVIMTTRSLYNSLYALYQPQQRFTDSETAKGGFSSLMFNGKPVIVDSHSPASHMLFLNEDYLNLYYHPDENFRFEPFQKPVNQNVKVAKIFWAGAFGSSNNRMHGGLTACTS